MAQGDSLRAAVRRGAPPVLVVFFVAVGASLRLDALAAIGLTALALSAVGWDSSGSACGSGPGFPGCPTRSGDHAWTGLVSQAGITLGFASIVAAEFPGWGSQMQLLLVASIAIHELVGPVLFRRGLAEAGELDARAPRPLVVVSNREPYLHSRDERRPDRRHGRHRRRRGGARRADARTRRRLDCARRRRGRPAGRRRQRQGAGAARQFLPTCCGACGSRSRRSRPTTAASPTRACGRCATWSTSDRSFAARTGPPTRTSTSASRPRFTPNSARPSAPVFIQDYHLALVAPALRARRPDVRTALFWHIPWPYPDRLRICPWRREIVAGLLANDLIAFQLERDRRNFLLAAEEELRRRGGARVVARPLRRAATRTVVSVPIGVDFDRIQGFAADAALAGEQERLRELLDLRAGVIGLGVDRLDYTKGIPERLDALDALMTRRPELRGRLTFVQIGVPSRSDLASYAAIEAEIGQRVADAQRASRRARRRAGRGLPHARRLARSAWWRSTAWRTSASSARCTTG